jgi:hypothetical protein
MALTPLAYVYCTESDLQALMSVAGETARLDDDQSGAIDGPEPGYLTNAINWATSKVNMYALALYAAQDLATSYLVNQWTIVLAAQWLSSRRGNPPPGSFADLYKETIEDLKSIRKGENQIPDIGYRDAAWPAWSNVRVDVLRTVQRVLVERSISERTPTPYRQHRDPLADTGFFEG